MISKKNGGIISKEEWAKLPNASKKMASKYSDYAKSKAKKHFVERPILHGIQAGLDFWKAGNPEHVENMLNDKRPHTRPDIVAKFLSDVSQSYIKGIKKVGINSLALTIPALQFLFSDDPL